MAILSSFIHSEELQAGHVNRRKRGTWELREVGAASEEAVLCISRRSWNISNRSTLTGSFGCIADRDAMEGDRPQWAHLRPTIRIKGARSKQIKGARLGLIWNNP